MMIHPRFWLNEALVHRFQEDPDAGILAAAVTDDEWASLDSGPLRGLHLGQPEALKDVVEEIVRGRRTYLLPRRSRRSQIRRPSETDASPEATRRITRDQALAILLSEQVERDPIDSHGVHAFRHQVLKDRLLSLPEVRGWIARERAAQGPFGRDAEDHGRMRERVTLLAYGTAESEWSSHVPTKQGSRLDRLRQISEDLASTYNWSRAQATIFVLTRDAPECPGVVPTIRRTFPLQACSRIVLTIDPTCTPREVAAVYRAVRRRHFGRLRRLTPRHTQLATFVGTHMDRPAAEQLKEWNQTQTPRYRYRRLSTFLRDARAAHRRLLHLRDKA